MPRRTKGESEEQEPPREIPADLFVVKNISDLEIEAVRAGRALVFTVTPDFDIFISCVSHDTILRARGLQLDASRLVEGHIRFDHLGEPKITWYNPIAKMHGSFSSMFVGSPFHCRVWEYEDSYEKKFEKSWRRKFGNSLSKLVPTAIVRNTSSPPPQPKVRIMVCGGLTTIVRNHPCAHVA